MNLLQKTVFLTAITCITWANQSLFAADVAATARDNIDVTPQQQQTTQEELAAIFVLSEICPSILGKNSGFDSGYARLVKDYWPTKDNAVQGLAKRATQDSFQKYLAQARDNAKNSSTQNNQDVCKDVIAYR